MMRKRWFFLMVVILISFSAVKVFAETDEELKIEEIEDVYAVKRAGLYYVQLSIDDDGIRAQRLLKINVLFSKSVLNKEAKEAIDARDFLLDEGRFEELSDSELILFSQAHAWDIETGESLPVKVVNKELGERSGSYRVTFSTIKGTEVTINAYEGWVYKNLLVDYKDQQLYDSGLRKSLTLPVILLSSLFFLPILLVIILYFVVQRQLQQTRNILFKK